MAENKPNTNLKKNKKADIPTKNGKSYSYQYIDIAQIHEYLEQNHMRYYQFIERIDNDDYIMTQRLFQEQDEEGNYIEESYMALEKPLRGCRVVDATLFGTDNPAQKQGSALTYARRYSLLMAFGLATEDDDAQSLNKEEPEVKITTLEEAENYKLPFGKYKGKTLKEIFNMDLSYIQWLEDKGDDQVKECLRIIDRNNKAMIIKPIEDDELPF